MEEGELPYHILFLDSLSLTLADHVHRLAPFEGATSGVEGLKSHLWFCESFDESMILLDNIV